MSTELHLDRSTLQEEIDLYQSYGITVHELPADLFPNQNLEVAGIYRRRRGLFRAIKNLFLRFDTTKRLIFIRKELPNCRKFRILLHERGHDICAESKCECKCTQSNQNTVLSELHAYRYTLSILLHRKLWNLLRAEIEYLDKYEARAQTDGFGSNSKAILSHAESSVQATKIIQKSILWEICKDGLANQITKKLYNEIVI